MLWSSCKNLAAHGLTVIVLTSQATVSCHVSLGQWWVT